MAVRSDRAELHFMSVVNIVSVSQFFSLYCVGMSVFPGYINTMKMVPAAMTVLTDCMIMASDPVRMPTHTVQIERMRMRPDAGQVQTVKMIHSVRMAS